MAKMPISHPKLTARHNKLDFRLWHLELKTDQHLSSENKSQFVTKQWFWSTSQTQKIIS